MIDGLDQLSSAVKGLARQFSGKNLERMTAAAAETVMEEIKPRAKGSIREGLRVTTSNTGKKAMATIEVSESAPGGKLHHAVFLEFGTSKMAAEPFMRSGFDASKIRAIESFSNEMVRQIEEESG